MRRIFILEVAAIAFTAWVSCGAVMASTSCSGISAQACYERGVDYTRNDRGVEQDIYTAHQLFTDACDKGSRDACNAMYRDAEAIADNTSDKSYIDHYAQVMIWTAEKSCYYQDMMMCYKAGRLHVNNQYGIKQDFKRGRSYLGKSCRAGIEHGCLFAGDLYVKGLGGQVDYWSAYDSYAMACNLGNEKGCPLARTYSYYDRKSGLGSSGPSMDEQTVMRAWEQSKKKDIWEGCERMRDRRGQSYIDCSKSGWRNRRGLTDPKPHWNQ